MVTDQNNTEESVTAEDPRYPPLTPDDAAVWRQPGKRCTEGQAAVLLNGYRPTRENLSSAPQIFFLGPDPPGTPPRPPESPVKRVVRETREAIEDAMVEGVLPHDPRHPLPLILRHVLEWAESIRQADPDRYPGVPLLRSDSPQTQLAPSPTQRPVRRHRSTPAWDTLRNDYQEFSNKNNRRPRQGEFIAYHSRRDRHYGRTTIQTHWAALEKLK